MYIFVTNLYILTLYLFAKYLFLNLIDIYIYFLKKKKKK